MKEKRLAKNRQKRKRQICFHFLNFILSQQLYYKCQTNQSLTFAKISIFVISALKKGRKPNIEELQRKAAAVTAQSKTSATKYNSTNHVCGHTVIVESLFSTAGHIMTPSRKHMDPSTFEMLLLLKVNKDMYNSLTLDECIEELSKEEA